MRMCNGLFVLLFIEEPQSLKKIMPEEGQDSPGDNEEKRARRDPIRRKAKISCGCDQGDRKTHQYPEIIELVPRRATHARILSKSTLIAKWKFFRVLRSNPFRVVFEGGAIPG